MRMDEIGYNHRHDKSFLIDRPNGAGDWLMLIVKSKSVFRIDEKNIHAPANSFIIYTPEYPEYYHADNCEYVDDWIHFGPDEEELVLMHQLCIPLNKIVAVADVTQISSIVRNMCYEQYSANKNRKETVDLYFRILLYKLNECTETAVPTSSINQNKYFEKLLWLRESIYRWPAREWGIDEMAEELALSRSRLQHLYSDTFGVSISRDMIASRLDKAKDLLKNPDLTINQISAIVGYGNPSYFNRQFKAAFGTTPSCFREEYFQKKRK